MFKKLIVLILASWIFVSCSSTRIAPGYSDAYKLVKDYFFGVDSKLITQELVSKIPYASMKVRIGKGDPGLLILESISNNKEYWLSADDVFLVIKDGRIISSKGLNNNLTNVIIPKNYSLKRDSGLSYKFYYSYDKPKLESFDLSVTKTNKGIEEVMLLTGNTNLTLIEETLYNKYTGWKVTNKFWIDGEGFVRKSIQNISPKIPPIEIEVTKRPSV